MRVLHLNHHLAAAHERHGTWNPDQIGKLREAGWLDEAKALATSEAAVVDHLTKLSEELGRGLRAVGAATRITEALGRTSPEG